VGADKSAVGAINRPLQLVDVTGVLEKFESGWLTVSGRSGRSGVSLCRECWVCHCVKTVDSVGYVAVSRVSGVLQCSS
jgi:hypothetical protein